MQHLFADSFAQQRQAELLREAEMARLARLAAGAASRRGILATAVAAIGRFIVGETGVATRHAPTTTGNATGATTTSAGAPAAIAGGGVGRSTTASRAVSRPSPSL